MKTVAFIPCRMAAKRFPGKPIALINGIPMIQHIFLRLKFCKHIQDIYIATCDEKIAQVAKQFTSNIIMTSDKHVRCTDRIAEAAKSVDCDFIINVQGDEPLISPVAVDDLAITLTKNKTRSIVNSVQAISSQEEIMSANVVKVVFGKQNQVLYFSREPIPSNKLSSHKFYYKQLGLIGFSRDALNLYADLPETPLEQQESVDMLRLIENGIPITIVTTNFQSIAVDEPKDIALVEKALTKDGYYLQYNKLI